MSIMSFKPPPSTVYWGVGMATVETARKAAERKRPEMDFEMSIVGMAGWVWGPVMDGVFSMVL